MQESEPNPTSDSEVSIPFDEVSAETPEKPRTIRAMYVATNRLGKFFIGIVSTIFAIILSTVVGGVIANRCTGFPLAYQQIRSITCPPPTQTSLSDFVVVVAPFTYQGSGNNQIAQNASSTVHRDLIQSIGSNQAGFIVLGSDDPWVDRLQATDVEDTSSYAQVHIDRFNADVLISGEVVEQADGSLSVSPAFYFADGSNFSSNSVTDDVEELRRQLTVFESLSKSQTNSISAIGFLYAGNVALEIAVATKQDFEETNNCLPNRCEVYSSDVTDAFQLAWKNYTGVLTTVNDELSYRALVGRGNVHFRLSQVIRTTTDSTDSPVRYECQTGELLFGEQSSDQLNWVQRSRVALACYDQAASLSTLNPNTQLRTAFGRAQTIEWLEREGIEDPTATAKEYGKVIEQYELSGQVDQLELEQSMTCLVGLAHGNRALANIRANLTVPGETPQQDLNTAIDYLDPNSETSTYDCGLSNVVDSFEFELDLLPTQTQPTTGTP